MNLPHWRVNYKGSYSIRSRETLSYAHPDLITVIDRLVDSMCAYPDAQKVLERFVRC